MSIGIICASVIAGAVSSTTAAKIVVPALSFCQITWIVVDFGDRKLTRFHDEVVRDRRTPVGCDKIRLRSVIDIVKISNDDARILGDDDRIISSQLSSRRTW